MRIVWLIIAVVLVYVGLRAAVTYFSTESVAHGPVDREGKRQLADCPDTPNCQGSQSSRTEQLLSPFSFTSPPEDVIRQLATLVSQQAGARIVTQNDEYLHATFKTALMGYIDDLEFLLDEPGGVVHVRSASRLGKSDLGANRKRIEALRAATAATIDKP